MGKKAVVLSGGGAKGGYQIGVWKVLRQMGFTPDIVVGTSVGALNGALMALDNFDAALDIWENMSMDSVFQNFVNMSDEENPDRESYIKELAKEAIFKAVSELLDDKFEIEISYLTYWFSYLGSEEVKYTIDGNEYSAVNEDEISKVFDENRNLLPRLTFTYELDNGNYVLKSVD